MKRVFLPLLVLGLLASPLWGDEPAALKVHMIGHGEYSPEESLPVLKRALEEQFRVECTLSLKLEKNRLDNLDALKSADMMVIFARRMNLAKDQMDIIRNHWEQGKPIVGIRTASHAFQKEDNEIFDKKVLGGSYGGGLKVVLAKGAADHPVLKGVQPFRPSKYLYGQAKLADDAQVLQVQGTTPQTWVHTYKGGRTLYTSAGAPDDFRDENFRRLLVNAVLWTAQRDPEKMKRTK
jgi:type 1 glutamine amidotransferase